MQTKFLKNFLSVISCCFYAAFFILIPINSYSTNLLDEPKNYSEYRGNRCHTGTIDYDPLGANKDITWELSNPQCAGFVTWLGGAIVSAGIASKLACDATNPLGLGKISYEQLAELEPDIPIITPSTAKKMLSRFARCSARGSEATILGNLAAAAATTPMGPLYSSQAAMATQDTMRCCASYAGYAAAVGVGLSALAVTYRFAKVAYENTTICGEGWNKWEEKCRSEEACRDQDKIWVKTQGDYARCLVEAFARNNPNSADCAGFKIDNSTRIVNKNYREYIYGGKEYEDNGCKNPWSKAERMTRLGYDSDNQRYYVKGSGAAPSFACYRFLSSNPNDKEAMEAFECCKKRSQSTLCIETNNDIAGPAHRSDYKFCEVGSRCSVVDVTFEVYESKKVQNYVCAKTYSVCPYNHLLGGGTETSAVDPNDTSLTLNTCQYLNHCWKVPILPTVRQSSLDQGFISSSCKDMKGDSQNFYSYDAGIIPLNTKSFSAPMAQCVKETMENVMLHRGGDTKCLDPEEQPFRDVCKSGYEYRKGYILKNQSFFAKIQDRLQSFIQILLILSITMFGVMVLFAVPNAAIEKKKLLPYIFKIGLVLYFATGDAWQSGFTEGILNSSTFLSEAVFNVDEDKDSSQLDGCQFPRFNYADSDESTRYNPSRAAYPEGKSYLRIWDTLDCKIARALGFGPEVSAPNLLIMAVGGLFTGGFGVMFVVAAFIFAFLLISMTIRALHIFLLSVVSIVLLIYISPITIAASLFERTKGIFQGWLKQLTGFALQPMILFAYLALMITMFDTITIGNDLHFTGDGRTQMKRMICEGAAENSSLYCIFKIPNISTYHGLEIIGIGIPQLISMNADKMNSIFKGAIMMFVFFSFMDKISYFAKKLVGGEGLNSSWNLSPQKAAGKAYSIGRGIQKRVIGGLAKHGTAAAKKVGRGAASAVRSATSKGKSMDKAQNISGASHSSSGGGASKTGGAGGASQVGAAGGVSQAGGSGAGGSNSSSNPPTSP